MHLRCPVFFLSPWLGGFGLRRCWCPAEDGGEAAPRRRLVLSGRMVAAAPARPLLSPPPSAAPGIVPWCAGRSGGRPWGLRGSACSLSRPDPWARGPHSCFFRESLAAPTALLKVSCLIFYRGETRRAQRTIFKCAFCRHLAGSQCPTTTVTITFSFSSPQEETPDALSRHCLSPPPPTPETARLTTFVKQRPRDPSVPLRWRLTRRKTKILALSRLPGSPGDLGRNSWARWCWRHSTGRCRIGVAALPGG